MVNNELKKFVISGLLDLLSDLDEHEDLSYDNINESTPLMGPQSILDSISLVSLIVDIEQRINEKYGISITIVDERAMSQKNSPFQTIKTLSEYIQLLIDEKR